MSATSERRADTAAKQPDPCASQSAEDYLSGTVLHSVRGHHVFETCVEQLATAIRLGVFPTGTTLPPERELAARMGASRATVREAIAALRAAGMVQTNRGRGRGTVVVHQPDVPSRQRAAALAGRRAELLDSLVFRRIVEPGAVQVAAGQHLDPVERQRLVDALRAVSSAPSSAAYRQADSRLHLALAHTTRSPSIVAAVSTVQAVVHDMLLAIPVLPVNIEHSTAQHEAIVAAVLAGRAQRARKVMEDHCADTAALLRGLLG